MVRSAVFVEWQNFVPDWCTRYSRFQTLLPYGQKQTHIWKNRNSDHGDTCLLRCDVCSVVDAHRHSKIICRLHVSWWWVVGSSETSVDSQTKNHFRNPGLVSFHPGIYCFLWRFHMIPGGHTALWHVADNIPTYDLTRSTILCFLLLLTVWKAGNSVLKQRLEGGGCICRLQCCHVA